MKAVHTASGPARAMRVIGMVHDVCCIAWQRGHIYSIKLQHRFVAL